MAEAQGTSGEGSVTVTETEENTVSPKTLKRNLTSMRILEKSSKNWLSEFEKSPDHHKKEDADLDGYSS